MNLVRHDWTLERLKGLYDLPLLKLISESHTIHTKFHPPNEIQVCSLISIKTGGCPEDCKYCAQSARYQTGLKGEPMMKFETVLKEAKKAIARGATRICLGAAWREVRESQQFEEVLRMIKEIAELGVEVCCTLGMLKKEQAKRLKEAGLYAYNHNLDTSKAYYPTIISTRSYEDRLATLNHVQAANLSVCCGGILGLGESIQDRLELLLTLCTRNPHPESVPINRLSQIEGTPLENQPHVSIWELLRILAIARITMPKTMIRISCGRQDMSYESQALCFIAGANSLFMGEKYLTVANMPPNQDESLFQLLGLKKKKAFAR